MNRQRKTSTPHPCPICGKTVNHVKQHMITHAPKSIRCTDCAYTTNRSVLLRLHILNKHRTENSKNYSCTTCNRLFVTKSALDAHQQSHSYTQCDICFKTLMTSALRAHKQSHGPKTFACAHCPQKFHRNHVMLNHVKKCHQKNVAFQHQCDSCHLSYFRKSDLTKHVRREHNETMPLCNICRNRHSTHLKCHFLCAICYNTFSDIRLLQLHQITSCNDGVTTMDNLQQVKFLAPTDYPIPPPLTSQTVHLPPTHQETETKRCIKENIQEVPVKEATGQELASYFLNTDPVEANPAPSQFVPHFCDKCGVHIKNKIMYDKHMPCIEYF